MEENAREEERVRAPLVKTDEMCGSCGDPVGELPFIPRPGSKVYCHPCHKGRLEERRTRFEG